MKTSVKRIFTIFTAAICVQLFIVGQARATLIETFSQTVGPVELVKGDCTGQPARREVQQVVGTLLVESSKLTATSNRTPLREDH